MVNTTRGKCGFTSSLRWCLKTHSQFECSTCCVMNKRCLAAILLIMRAIVRYFTWWWYYCDFNNYHLSSQLSAGITTTSTSERDMDGRFVYARNIYLPTHYLLSLFTICELVSIYRNSPVTIVKCRWNFLYGLFSN